MKNKMSKVVMVTAALTLSASLLAACGSSSTSSTSTSSSAKPASSNASKPYIPVISKGFQHQFWQAVKQGAEKAAKEFDVNITFEGPETEAQVDKQIEMLQAALDKKPTAIAFAALDSKASVSLLQKAKSANIPVIGFDSGVDSDIPVTTAATDNKKAAALAADKMAEKIGDAGEVALVVHDQTSRTGVDRRDGFVDQMKAKHPNIKIVDIQYGGGDQLKSTDLAKAIIQGHPNLKGIFGANEGSAIGVVNAVTELKNDKLVIIGYDSGKAQIDAIKSGKMAGAITQDPIGIGYWSVKAAVMASKGEKVEKTIDTGFHWYDKTNIDSAEIKVLLYN
ncbi:ABC transporter substrate-binding protein [Paenibacillus sp. CGMCC 1.16610]|uniref:Substrate-binding domain-containing protein n=1 Tax=Paenibacillus anseongense TaxID=2682845 RepID=A0ABW9UBI0_9BACL|nr:MULTISPECIES: ABC transporter substrate-binding protein [Paenibacillus]MBA2938446.1 ABC transporter substrate-binding protein [Paenibacillus sp. CGMCC 1.16610]MVQ37504.1 substrate-binding domain-containing protein [Paenibacillus anseongense]